MRVISVRGVSIGLIVQLIAATGWPVMPQPAPMPDPGRFFQDQPGSGYTKPRIKKPKVKKTTAPHYPPEIAALGVEGTVAIMVSVDARGRPGKLRVIRSDNPLLNQAALDTVSRWEFSPGRVGGEPAGIDLEVEVKFSLGSREQQEASASLPDKSPVRPVYRVAPEYPADAELVALSGEVVVEFVVGEKGEVRDPQVVQTSHSVFNDAAIKAIKQWAFIPARAQGRPRATRMQVPFVFKQPEGPLKQEVRIALPYGSERPELHATAQAAQAVIEQRKRLNGAVYPFAELLENKQGTVEAALEQDEDGRVTAVHWRGDAAQPFRLAIEAMLDARKPGELPRVSGQTVRWEFNPYDGDVRIGDAAAAILKKLRLGDADAAFVKEAELDEKPVLMQRIEPAFPTRLPPEVSGGEATVEFFLAENGRVLLPRVVSASAPEFGCAACQALASWQFMFPRKNGGTVVALMRREFDFQRSAGMDPPAETVDITAFAQPNAASSAHEVDAAPTPDKLVQPEYPWKLRQEGIRGTVVITFVVTPKGDVVNARVENQTQEAFAEAVLEALKQSTFKPGHKAGRPVHTRMQLTVHFTDPTRQTTGRYEVTAYNKGDAET